MKTEARIDKWLWAARIYKTRSIAVDAIKNGRVTIDGAAVAAVGKDSGTHCHAIHLEVVDRTDHAACITGQTLHRHILRHIAVLCLKTLGRFAGGCAQQAARKQLTICETAIAKLEASLAALDQDMEAAACDAERLGELYRQHQEVEAELEREMTRWEELSLQAEEQEI